MPLYIFQQAYGKSWVTSGGGWERWESKHQRWGFEQMRKLIAARRERAVIFGNGYDASYLALRSEEAEKCVHACCGLCGYVKDRHSRTHRLNAAICCGSIELNCVSQVNLGD